MTEHYFTANPQSRSHPRLFKLTIRGRELDLTTDAGVFAATGLDRGTRLLIEALVVPPEARCLVDLGCGYGPIGLALALLAPTARVFLVDPNERACMLAKANAAKNLIANVTVVQGEGLSAIPGEIDLVATNPPIRAGKKVVYGLMAEAAQRLKAGGALWTVIRTSQGAKSLEAELGRVFREVMEVEKGGGFRVYRAVR
ncbi:MAG: class I SAM-dependent methyltransferase [Bacteroidota bacterium]